MTVFTALAIGLVAGVFSGMFGIGGGLIIVPALIMLMKMEPLGAIGTSLAAPIPPVSLLGAIEYHRAGHMNLKYAMLIALGLFMGAYFGARILLGLPPALVRKLYGIFLLVIATRMLFFQK